MMIVVGGNDSAADNRHSLGNARARARRRGKTRYHETFSGAMPRPLGFPGRVAD
jgi:hypothetical protein